MDVELVPVTFRMPESVEVAVDVPLKVVKVRGPVNTPAPVTDNGVPGEVVEIPRIDETYKSVVVAFVLVALIITRLVMVEVALLTRMPPVRVESPPA